MRPRTGNIFIAVGAALTLLGTLAHVFPPHETYLAVILGLAGALSYTLGVSKIAGVTRKTRGAAPYVVVAACATWGGMMGVAPVAGDTLALAAFGESRTCTVTDVASETRRTRSGRSTTYVHQVRCPDTRVHEVRTGPGQRREPGSAVEIVVDAKGLLTADFAPDAQRWGSVGVFGALLSCVCAIPFLARRIAAPPPPPPPPAQAPPSFSPPAYPQPPTPPWPRQPHRRP